MEGEKEWQGKSGFDRSLERDVSVILELSFWKRKKESAWKHLDLSQKITLVTYYQTPLKHAGFMCYHGSFEEK